MHLHFARPTKAHGRAHVPPTKVFPRLAVSGGE